MAKYTVTRACGHDEVVVLFGKGRDREWRLENVEPSKLCTECYQVELARQREKENQEAAEAAKEMSLPELTGSEKQVTWAETLRLTFLDKASFVLLETFGFTTTGLGSAFKTGVGFNGFSFCGMTTLSSVVFSCDNIASSGVDFVGVCLA